jgi:hypothetical protein
MANAVYIEGMKGSQGTPSIGLGPNIADSVTPQSYTLGGYYRRSVGSAQCRD